MVGLWPSVASQRVQLREELIQGRRGENPQPMQEGTPVEGTQLKHEGDRRNRQAILDRRYDMLIVLGRIRDRTLRYAPRAERHPDDPDAPADLEWPMSPADTARQLQM